MANLSPGANLAWHIAAYEAGEAEYHFIEKEHLFIGILSLDKVDAGAAELRANYSIKTPDAIQIATAIIHGANNFLTNDPALKRIDSINVLVLDEEIVYVL